MTEVEGIDLQRGVEIIRKRMWIVLGFVLLPALIAFLLTFVLSSTYQATATLLIEPSQDIRVSDYSDIIAAQQLAQTYSQMLKGGAVLGSVSQQLGLEEPLEKLTKKISVTPINDTQLIRLSVKDSSASRAALLANTIADVFTRYIQSMQAERYSSSLTDIQKKMDSTSALMQDSQTKIDQFSLESINKGTELTRLNSLLEGYRAEYASLQQSDQSLQLAVSQMSEKISIVGDTQVQKNSLVNTHTARVMMLVDPTLIVGQSAYSSVTSSERIALTYGQMMIGKPVLESAVARSGVNLSADEVAKLVSVSPILNTQLINLSVEDVDESRARLLAENIALVFVSQIRDLLSQPYTERMKTTQAQMSDLAVKIDQTQESIKTITAEKLTKEKDLSNLSALRAEYYGDYRALQQEYDQLRLTAVRASNTVIIAERAQIPESPMQNRWVYVFLAAVIGLFSGIGLVFLMDQFNESITTRKDITTKLGLRSLGAISTMQNGENDIVMGSQTDMHVEEDFRGLAMHLYLSIMDDQFHTLVVTSPRSAEGKSFVTANLAIAMAKSGLNVILVDADLRFPRLHTVFDVEQSNGLTETLESTKKFNYLRETQEKGLKLLTSGDLPENPVQTLSSPKLKQLLDQLAQQAQIVLIDCPPLSLADSMVLASKTDGVLLVMSAGQTKFSDAKEAVDGLHQVGAKLVGVVLNRVPGHNDRYYQYHASSSKWSKKLQIPNLQALITWLRPTK